MKLIQIREDNFPTQQAYWRANVNKSNITLMSWVTIQARDLKKLHTERAKNKFQRREFGL
jgi:hypothetical protein